jgi:hypothetical protein
MNAIRETKKGDIFASGKKHKESGYKSEYQTFKAKNKKEPQKLLPKTKREEVESQRDSIAPTEGDDDLNNNIDSASIKDSTDEYEDKMDKNINKSPITNTTPKVLGGSKKQHDSIDSEKSEYRCQCLYNTVDYTIHNSTLQKHNSLEPCSKYCRYLNPEDEKRIILKPSESINEFSDSEPGDDDKYAVSAKWWRKWCSFM